MKPCGDTSLLNLFSITVRITLLCVKHFKGKSTTCMNIFMYIKGIGRLIRYYIRSYIDIQSNALIETYNIMHNINYIGHYIKYVSHYIVILHHKVNCLYCSRLVFQRP